MNFVERYIKDFDQEESNRIRKSNNNVLTDRVSANRSLSPEDKGNILDKHFSSVDGDTTIAITEPNAIAKKNCIKYSSIRDQKSE
jgi:hypothetical protein